ncbi:MAG: ABC transporter substrate-binding protein [Anaerolineae bacterium]
MSLKKLSRRDFLRTAALASAGLTLVACGGGAPATEEAETGAGEAQAEPTTAPTEPEGKLVWYAAQAADHLPPFEQQHEMWDEMYPKVEIEEVFVPWSEYPKKLTTMVAGGEPVDVVWVMIWNGLGGALNINTWLKDDALMDFTPVFEAGTMDPDEYFQGLLESFRVDGRYWGAPFECWLAVFWYNKTLFDQGGVDYPTEDWTWADYRDSAEKLTVRTEGRTEQFGTYTGPWTTFVYQAGGDLVSEDKQEVTLQTEAARTGFEEYYWYTFNGYSPVGDDTKVFSGLQSGKIATHVHGNYMWTSFREVSKELEFDFAATRLPAGPGPEPINKAGWAGFNVWSAFKASQYPELAQEFVIHLGYGKGAEPWAATGRVSPLKRFDLDYYQEVADLTEEEKARYATVLNATFKKLEIGEIHPNQEGLDIEGVPPTVFMGPYNEEINKAVIDKSQSLDEALEIAAQRTQTAIEDAQRETGG